MNMSEENVYVAWISHEFGAINHEHFKEEVYKFVQEWNEPSLWVLDYIGHEEWDRIYDHDELSPEFIMKILKLAFVKYQMKSVQLRSALERFFLCSEYGDFDCPNESLNYIYELYQAPKLEPSESTLQGKIYNVFKNA